MIKKFTSMDEISAISSGETFNPQIAVIGVGGAGTNAINNMINLGIQGVKFIVVNTDSQSITQSVSPCKIQIGPKVTRGLGAGSKPEIGMQAAEESMEDIKAALTGINMLFITAGMGGGTGTGASQVIARIAKDLDILTLAFVTKPFIFEGIQRKDIASSGTDELEKYVDSIVVMSNQSLFKVINNKTSMVDAFRVTDNILYSGIRAITDLITSNGLVNLDFNDIKSVLEGMGRTMIGSFECEGEDRAVRVAEGCISNPLLEDETIRGAKRILINIAGGDDMTLYEVDTIVSTIRNELDPEAFIHFGTVEDNSLRDTIRVCIVATGLPRNNSPHDEIRDEKIHSHSRDSEKQHINSSRFNNVHSRSSDVHSMMPSAKSKPHHVEETSELADEEHYIEDNLRDYRNEPVKYSKSDINKEDVVSNPRIFASLMKSKSITPGMQINEEIEDIEEIEIERPLEMSKKQLSQDDVQEHISSVQYKSVKPKMISETVEDNYENITYYDEIETENNRKANKINLFDMITKNKAAAVSNKNSTETINSIKEKNQPIKEKVKEDSFFDLPSFLKKK